MKKEIHNQDLTEVFKRYPDLRITINPDIKSEDIKVNPKKIEDAKRFLSNLKEPLPWDKK